MLRAIANTVGGSKHSDLREAIRSDRPTNGVNGSDLQLFNYELNHAGVVYRSKRDVGTKCIIKDDDMILNDLVYKVLVTTMRGVHAHILYI